MRLRWLSLWVWGCSTPGVLKSTQHRANRAGQPPHAGEFSCSALADLRGANWDAPTQQARVPHSCRNGVVCVCKGVLHLSSPAAAARATCNMEAPLDPPTPLHCSRCCVRRPHPGTGAAALSAVGRREAVGKGSRSIWVGFPCVRPMALVQHTTPSIPFLPFARTAPLTDCTLPPRGQRQLPHGGAGRGCMHPQRPWACAWLHGQPRRSVRRAHAPCAAHSRQQRPALPACCIEHS